MNKEELKNYLSENLRIEAYDDTECDSNIIVVNLYLENEIISTAQAYVD